MTELALAVAVLVTIAVPHVVPLDRVAPLRMATVWLLALSLRALTAVAVTLVVVADLHGPDPVITIQDWHPQHALSSVSAALDVAAHPAAHVVASIPLLLIGGALAAFALSLVHGGWVLRRVLSAAVEGGPLDTSIVRDDRVLVAVAGIGRGRVLLSDSALAALDADELEAAVAHERGHVRRRHRPLLLLVDLLAAVAWMLPGTRHARRQFKTSLECDADDYATRVTGNPLALAGAICKAATTAPARAMPLRGPGPVTLRLQRLLGEGPSSGTVALRHPSSSLVVLLGIVVALVAEVVISLAVFAPDVLHMLDPFHLLAGSGDH